MILFARQPELYPGGRRMMQIVTRMLLLLVLCLYVAVAFSGCGRKKAPPPQSPVIGSRFRTQDKSASKEYAGPGPEYGGSPPPAPAASPQTLPQVSITPAPAKPAAAVPKPHAQPLWRRNTYKWVKDNEYYHLQKSREPVPTNAGGKVFGSNGNNSAKRNLSVW
jgi:hypothetical protein